MKHDNDNKRPVKLLAFRDLKETRGIRFSYRHLYNLEEQEKFPRRVPIGENRVGWIESEIDDWLSKCVALRAA